MSTETFCYNKKIIEKQNKFFSKTKIFNNKNNYWKNHNYFMKGVLNNTKQHVLLCT